MTAGNEILARILKCFDEILDLPPEEIEALANRYWDFVDQREAKRTEHGVRTESLDEQRWEGPFVDWHAQSLEAPATAGSEAVGSYIYERQDLLEALDKLLWADRRHPPIGRYCSQPVCVSETALLEKPIEDLSTAWQENGLISRVDEDTFESKLTSQTDSCDDEFTLELLAA